MNDLKSSNDIPTDNSYEIRPPSSCGHNFIDFSDSSRFKSFRPMLLPFASDGNSKLANSKLQESKKTDSRKMEAQTLKRHEAFSLKPVSNMDSNFKRAESTHVNANMIRFVGKIAQNIVKTRRNLKYTKIENLNQRQLEIINDYSFHKKELESKRFKGTRGPIEVFIRKYAMVTWTTIARCIKKGKLKNKIFYRWGGGGPESKGIEIKINKIGVEKIFLVSIQHQKS